MRLLICLAAALLVGCAGADSRDAVVDLSGPVHRSSVTWPNADQVLEPIPGARLGNTGIYVRDVEQKNGHWVFTLEADRSGGCDVRVRMFDAEGVEHRVGESMSWQAVSLRSHETTYLISPVWQIGEARIEWREVAS